MLEIPNSLREKQAVIRCGGLKGDALNSGLGVSLTLAISLFFALMCAEGRNFVPLEPCTQDGHAQWVLDTEGKVRAGGISDTDPLPLLLSVCQEGLGFIGALVFHSPTHPGVSLPSWAWIAVLSLLVFISVIPSSLSL